MKYLLIFVTLTAITLIGCSNVQDVEKDAHKENIDKFTLPPTVSYIEAIRVCNLTNLTHLTLKNYNGRWIWNLATFSNENLIRIGCRVNAEDGKVIKIEQIVLPNLPVSTKYIPAEKIKIDEHSAVEIALKNKEVVEWLAKHDNAIIDRISLESSPKHTLWRIMWADESRFAVLTASINATTGEQISVYRFGG